ncbi:MAG: serine/threonine-protein kinase [Phycisphaerae bacterium]|nr:serine/threonine-protein kinase [Phycisphaerae bacterium]
MCPPRDHELDSQRHLRISELFAEALRLDPSVRDAFLESRCGDDAGLLRELQSLFAHHHERGVATPGHAGAGLVTGAFNISELVDDKLGESPGPGLGSAFASTGRYTIIRLLGEGGMGAVYLAEQERPRRTVALKVMRAGFGSMNRLRQRFELETEVLGRLQHPGIARIYDAGTATVKTAEGSVSVPYFAMEYVDGMSLLEYAEHHALGTRERMRIVAMIAEAVAAAHRQGIIHRDIKPQNVVVDHAGDPKVLDFGVARATDSDLAVTTIQTDIGQLIGTLGYMSPEQVSGDPSKIDARTDVYALGALTHELLTGKPLVDSRQRTVSEVVRIIQDVEPPSLSSINRTFRGDLDTIVAKAIDKDPSRRYDDATSFAADVRRYLQVEPIVARPATHLYRIGKFARRNRVLVGGVVATFLALALGLVGMSIGFINARTERDAAIAAQNTADARFDEVRKLAKTLVFDIHDMIAVLPGSTEARKKIVTTALEYLDRLGAEQSDDEALQMELSEGYLKVGQAQGYGSRAHLGDRAGAMQNFRKAEVIRKRMLARDPESEEWLGGLGSVQNQIALLELDSGHAQEALAMFEEVLANRERILAKAPEDPKKRRSVAISHQWIGNTYLKMAVPLSKESDDPAVAARRTELLMKGLDAYRTMQAIYVAIAAPDDPMPTRDLTVASEKIGDLYSELGELESALVEYRKSLEIRTRVYAENPDNHELRSDLVAATGKLGDRMVKLGEFDEAEPYLQQSHTLASAAVREDPSDVLAKTNLVVSEYRIGELAAARSKDASRPIASRKALLDEAMSRFGAAAAILRELADIGKLDETGRGWLASFEEGIKDLAARRAALEAETSS